jgi:hypothetical protein
MFLPYEDKPHKLKGQYTDLTDRQVKIELDDSSSIIKGTKPLGEMVFDKWNTITRVNDENAPTAKLRDILRHPDLYKDFPEIASIWVLPKEGKGASLVQNMPGFNTYVIEADKNLSGPELKKVIAHEIQHAIQYQCGFANGGNSSQFREIDHTQKELALNRDAQNEILQNNSAFYHSVTQANQAMLNVTDKYGEVGKADPEDQIVKDWWTKLDYRDSFPESSKYFALKQTEFYLNRDGGLKTAPEDQYRNLAGEEEARRTAARIDMKATDRVGRPYDRTDIKHLENLIVTALPRSMQKHRRAKGMEI